MGASLPAGLLGRRRWGNRAELPLAKPVDGELRRSKLCLDHATPAQTRRRAATSEAHPTNRNEFALLGWSLVVVHRGKRPVRNKRLLPLGVDFADRIPSDARNVLDHDNSCHNAKDNPNHFLTRVDRPSMSSPGEALAPLPGDGISLHRASDRPSPESTDRHCGSFIQRAAQFFQRISSGASPISGSAKDV